MKKSNYKKIIFLVLLFVLIIFSARAIYMNTYNWDSTVQKYLNNFSVDTKFIESYKDKSSNSIIYKCQTNDNLQIPFEVTCSWGKKTTPFGFKELISTKILNDNLGEQLCNYISENKGTYNIENKSVKEISEYILEIIQYSNDLLYKYDIEYNSTSISFTLVDNEKTYDFKYGNTSETILQDKLTELLYK